MATGERLQYLVTRYLDDTCTPTELQEFWEKLRSEEDEGVMREELELLWQSDGQVDGRNWEPALQKMYQEAETWRNKGKVVTMSWKRWAVAASILLVLGLGSHWLLIDKKAEPENRPSASSGLASDVKAPETNRAMITLADGRKVYLDTVGSGQLAVEQNVVVSKTADGQIIYDKDARLTSSVAVYNTLSNPRGSNVIDVTLSDGSRVWLNAGSSITYPVAFINNDRKVTITGEAYFEITHDASKPFKVSKGEMEVTVLGTHFNVNAYDDEENIKVTLLEGSVKVKNTIIKPAQQAVVATDVKVINDVDVEQVMAWQRGLFEFNNTTLDVILRQVSRWYDLEIVYERQPGNAKFGGGLSRKLPLSNVLKLLEANGGKFELDGRRLIVK